MGYAERNTWAGLVASVIAVAVYAVMVLPQLSRVPVAEVEWILPMAFTIGFGIVLSIALSISWGILARALDPDTEHRADQRDREIEWLGDRVGQAFLVLGGLAGIILAMVDAESFWIGNAIFVGFFLSAFVGGITQLVVYRRGMP